MIDLKKSQIVLFALLLGIGTASSQDSSYLFLITLDGLRWQELYGGADSMLITHTEYVKDTASLREKFWEDTFEARRRKLMPFFWKTIADRGQLYGNRNTGNKVNCSNIFWFSYPGYAEILCGKTNANAIHSNDKINNPDTTFLEHINRLPDHKGKVAAFTSWDVFPYIINEDRSGIPVNAGFRLADHSQLSEREKFLNQLQAEIPSPWATVRLDAFTHHYALQYIDQYEPNAVYISYGETDDFAHDGRYDHYLNSAHQTDKFIAALWQFIQTHPKYRDRTNMIITTDHGRGDWKDGAWKSHGKTYIGSSAIWLAAIGPAVNSLGEMNSPMQLWQNQVAATCLKIIGGSHLISADMGKPINSIFKKG